jgi:hypothetical protein
MAKKEYSQQDKAEWMNDRLNAENARGVHSKGINSLPKVSDLTKQIDASLKANAPKDNGTKQIHRAKTLVAVTDDSECFSDLRFSAKDQGVYGTFRRDGYEEFWPMSRADALAWFSDDLGRYYNDVIRGN